MKHSISSNFRDGTAVVSRAFKDLEQAPRSDIERHAASYSTGYLALRSLIRDRTDPRDEGQLLAAGYAVYGWMPTILKRTENLVPLSEFVIEVRALPFFGALPIVQRAVAQDQGVVLRSLNNSVVGTSKLLHFLMPDLFPIWDSRIAKLFGFNGRHNSPTAYLSYFELLHQWCMGGGSVPQRLAQTLQTGAPENDPVSQLRLLNTPCF